jgi:peptide deformylase
MTVRKIVLVGNPVLRQECTEIREFDSADMVVADLRDTLLDFRTNNGFGSGIAAPQIGISVRALYISTKEFEGELLNPKITSHSKETGLFWDACFSFEGAFFMKVKRWTSVEVEYFDLSGKKKSINGMSEHLAALMQHEIDHLNRTLFIDHVVREGEYVIPTSVWIKMSKPLRAD